MRDKEVIKRFEEELTAKGITSDGAISWKEASLKAKWTSGKHAGESLGGTYVRDALMKEKRGSFEGVELICNAWGLDWPYVKTGKRGAAKGGYPSLYNYKDNVNEAVNYIDRARNMLALIRARASGIAGGNLEDDAITAHGIVETAGAASGYLADAIEALMRGDGGK